MRGRRRKVVEVLAVERSSGMHLCSVRLECGHVTIAQARSRYRRNEWPSIAYCKRPECIMAPGVEP